jgi:hypothetical protein
MPDEVTILNIPEHSGEVSTGVPGPLHTAIHCVTTSCMGLSPSACLPGRACLPGGAAQLTTTLTHRCTVVIPVSLTPAGLLSHTAVSQQLPRWPRNITNTQPDTECFLAARTGQRLQIETVASDPGHPCHHKHTWHSS